MAVRIVPVETVEEAEYFRTLTAMVWESPVEDTVPVHVTVTAIHNGGGLLVAYADDGPPATNGMIGMTYWWPGLAEPTTGQSPGGLHLKMCSHMAGVLPPWRGTGLGLQLKLAQRHAILAQGATEWVTWTYDPLLRTNGLFNILRLGAVCNTYHVNLYGAMIDGLNAGWDSDRCQVDWWLTSQRVVERALAPARSAPRGLPRGAAVMQPPTSANPHGGLAAGALPLDGRALAVPLPEDIMALRALDPELSNAWRHYMRGVLAPAFAAGYVLADCVPLPEDGWGYLLVPATEVQDL